MSDEGYDWEAGQVAKVYLRNMYKRYDESDGKLIFNADEGRMTHHYRHIVFPNAEEVKKCLANGPNIIFTVESVSDTQNPGDPNGARPSSGFQHTFWHAKAGSVSSDAAANGQDE